MNTLIPAPLWVETATQRVLQEIGAILDMAPDFHIDDIDEDIIATIISDSFEEFANDFDRSGGDDDDGPEGDKMPEGIPTDFEVGPHGNVIDIRTRDAYVGRAS